MNNFERIKQMDIKQMVSLFVNELGADTDCLDPNLCMICEKENGCRLDEYDECDITNEDIFLYWLMSEVKEEGAHDE